MINKIAIRHRIENIYIDINMYIHIFINIYIYICMLVLFLEFCRNGSSAGGGDESLNSIVPSLQ